MYEHLAQAEQEAAEREHRLKVEEKEHGNGAGLKGCASVHFLETAATAAAAFYEEEKKDDEVKGQIKQTLRAKGAQRTPQEGGAKRPIYSII